MHPKRILPVILAILALAVPAPGRACTAFAAVSQQHYLVAKSFDWRTGDGFVVHDEKGRVRRPLFPDATGPAAWTARHASLSFTTLAPGLPISGMNDAGLVVEALVDLSVEPERTPRPGRLTGLEMVQYGLDSFERAGEFAQHVERVGISQLAVGLHFFACDRDARCVVIETEGEAVKLTHLNRKLYAQALANQPINEDRLDSGRGWLPAWLAKPLHRGSSAARFDRVASGLGAVTSRNDAFALLDRVSGPSTRWQIVWEPATGRVSFRDRGQRDRTIHALAIDANARCQAGVRVRDLSDVGGAFRPFSARDLARVERAVRAQAGSTADARALAARVAQWTSAPDCATVPPRP